MPGLRAYLALDDDREDGVRAAALDVERGRPDVSVSAPDFEDLEGLVLVEDGFFLQPLDVLPLLDVFAELQVAGVRVQQVEDVVVVYLEVRALDQELDIIDFLQLVADAHKQVLQNPWKHAALLVSQRLLSVAAKYRVRLPGTSLPIRKYAPVKAFASRNKQKN